MSFAEPLEFESIGLISECLTEVPHGQIQESIQNTKKTKQHPQ